ncbi:uncharacterized protein LOC134750965 isoform X2 [Cydia strobilella]|uniref:uncharacterized protein LOC134750965 isoform X2 n=1 Tax=Cydia strobilella TaxID=1100964 RepID=UPI003007905A
MDVTHACRCCLRRAPDKDLTTPYTHLGITEIYAYMIKECFDISLVVGGAGSCGICSACVGRLRDGCAFKLQVQRSQADLQARLQGESMEEEQSAVRSEYPERQDEDGTSEPASGEEPPVKLETLDAWMDGTPDEILHDMLRLNMAAGDGASDEDEPLLVEERAVKSELSDKASDEDCVSVPDARAREQLAMACSVVLERLRDDAIVHSGDKPYYCEHIQNTHLVDLKNLLVIFVVLHSKPNRLC